MNQYNHRICSSAAMQTLVCISVLFIAASCASHAGDTTAVKEKFQVIQPAVVDTSYNKEYVAEIQSVQNIEIRSRVKGFIEKIHVDEGKPVQAGQILFTLSSRAFREELLKANAGLKSAVAELKLAQVELKNTQLLVDKNIVSRTELEMAEAKIAASKAMIDERQSAIAVAKLNLSFTIVRAPFSGVINRIANKTGSLIDEGTLLTSLSNNTEMFAYFNMSEAEYLHIAPGDEKKKQNEVSLLMADNRVFPEKGFIETTENEIDISSGNIAFRARFANPGLLLKHGSSGKILVRKEVKNALIIPQKSTFEIQDKTYVYVLDSSNKVRMKNITVGLRLPHIYVIQSGITRDDRIIYEGIQQVKEGDMVSPELVTINSISLQPGS